MGENDVLSKKWLVSEESFDEEQKKIKDLKPGNYIIDGCAGSGKTVLALRKAFEIKEAELGSYLVVIFTHTLKDFIKDGITNLGLDEDRVCNFHQLTKQGYTSADYIIVDEVQDFNDYEIKKLVSMANKYFIFFGDDAQQLYSKKTNYTNMEKIRCISGINKNNYKKLTKNYRLPKSIAEFAQNISTNKNNNVVGQCVKEGGKKPIIRKLKNWQSELDYIQNIIEDGLLNVGILVKENKEVEKVKNYYESKGFDVEYKYYEVDENGEKKYPPIDKLNFYENTPKIITYHSSKGLQFDHVFLPMCDLENTGVDYQDALYVAATRASEELYITYSTKLSPFIESIDSNLFD